MAGAIGDQSYGANVQVLLSLDDVIEGADEGRIALPDFQRDFDWTPMRVVSLLTSVARQWPIGSLLIIQAERRVKHLGWGARPLSGAPEATDDASVLVLDGQQRLTSLYHALLDKSDDVYYCEIGKFAEEGAGEVDDDHIHSMRRNRFARAYRDEQAEAENGIIKISRLFSDREFRRWLNHIPDDQQDVMENMRLGPLGGLRSGKFAIPATRLEGEVPLPVVAKIFETMNRGALLLSAFDLMVARLWPRSFHLRDKWEEAKVEYSPSFDEMDGLEALQVIALREYLAGVKSVRGIRQSDILGLDPGAVERDWDRAVAALGRAVRFVKTCGAIRWNLIPAHTMLIPIADALWDGEVAGEKADLLQRWFWASTVRQTYAQGANTQAVTDANELRAWFMSRNAPPESVRLGIPDSLDESLSDTRRRNQMLTRGVLSLLISRDARDWIKNTRLLDAGDNERIDIHHVFPATYLKDRNIDGNVVANVTPLFGSTNKSLRSDPPSTVIERDNVLAYRIESHRVPLDAYRSDDWDAFIERRVEMLTEAFREELTS